MINKLSEKFESKIHLDHTLSDLRVTHLEANASDEQIVTWLKGTAEANNFDLSINQGIIVIKNKDFSQVKSLYIGKLDNEFIQTANDLGWDLFHISGSTIVEYPTAHETIIQKIIQSESSFYEFEINISLLNTSDEESKGLSPGAFFTFTVAGFDILNYTQPRSVINSPTLTLNWQHLNYIQDNTYSVILSCQSGTSTNQRIDKQSNYLTTQKDALGQITSQTVSTFTSGFIIDLIAYPRGSDAIVSVDLELSEDISTSEDELPVISRRSVRNTTQMKVNDTWLLGKFEINGENKEARNSFFLPWKSSRKFKEHMVVVCKRTK